MLNLLNTAQTAPFAIAIMLMLMLFVLEVVAFFIGGVNDWVDGLLPDGLTDPTHPEIGLDAVDAGGFVRFLSWLYVGRVPLLMLIVVFLAVFGLSGFILQSLVFAIFGLYLPSIIAVIVVLALCVPCLRVCGAILYKILPKDETTAIDASELIGRVGVIVIGNATQDKSAQVKVKDTHGQTHYVMAFADNDETLAQGDSVLLVAKDDKADMYFRMIKNESKVMVD